MVANVQRDREDADYATTTVFSEDEALRIVADAERFLTEARRILASGPPP